MNHIMKLECLCYDFRLNDSYAHYDAIMMNESNNLHVQSVGRWCVSSSSHLKTHEFRNTFQVPMTESNNVQIWHVSCRRVLSLKFRTFSVVTIDCLVSLSSKSIRRRVQCPVFTGRSANRMLCIHESNVVSAIELRSERSASLPAVTIDLSGNNVYESEDEKIDEREIDYILYVSNLPRSFFPCQADEIAARNLINSLMFRGALEEVLGAEIPTVGMDLERTCGRCETLIDNTKEEQRFSRVFALHTLHHGSLNVKVIDLKCERCGLLVPRELLDAWLRDVCGTEVHFGMRSIRGLKRITWRLLSATE